MLLMANVIYDFSVFSPRRKLENIYTLRKIIHEFLQSLWISKKFKLIFGFRKIATLR